MEYIIRLATPDDAKDVHDIYGTYVNEEHVTFTIDNPDIEDYRNKIIHTIKKPTHIIATKGPFSFVSKLPIVVAFNGVGSIIIGSLFFLLAIINHPIYLFIITEKRPIKKYFNFEC